jgi:hypothetical protein
MIYFVFVLVIFIIAVLVWFIQSYFKLRQQFVVLNDSLNAVKADVAGLCSAAVSIDNRLSDNNEQLLDVVEKVDDFENIESQSTQPYHSAIQKVRNGVTVEELVQQCGLNREEAVLLIRLHR